jgi:hypothetical protein
MLFLVACNFEDTYPGAAKEEFAREFSCPKGRVVVTPRPDLKAFDLVVGAHDRPPPDVAADPGRLAEWKRREREVEDGYRNEHAFHASGCGHEGYYVCGTAEGSHQQQVAACSKAAHPPGAAKKAK